MARPRFHEDVSPYYPPRARWYSKVHYSIDAVRRYLALDRLALPPEIHLRRLVLGILVPGLAVYFRRKRAGAIAMGATVVLALVFIAGLGYRTGNIAFGLMISLHVTGLTYLCEPWLRREPLSQRLIFSVLALLVVGVGVYLPARHFVERHLFMPLVTRDRVIVIHPTAYFKGVHRGDWVAYEMEEHSAGDPHNGGEVVVAGGMGFGPVLAVAGDEVTFSNGVFAVNGAWQPARPHMPSSGGITVSENQWFLWPEFDIHGHGNIGESALSSTLMNFAQVNPGQYRGKPYHRWFGRKQPLP